jgi:hypothetical protein
MSQHQAAMGEVEFPNHRRSIYPSKSLHSGQEAGILWIASIFVSSLLFPNLAVRHNRYGKGSWSRA